MARKTRMENDADTITCASHKFLLGHSRGQKPAVPDSVWHGDDCWIIEWPLGANGWRISERGHECMAVVSARAILANATE
jgi:hypothetical protein